MVWSTISLHITGARQGWRDLDDKDVVELSTVFTWIGDLRWRENENSSCLGRVSQSLGLDLYFGWFQIPRVKVEIRWWGYCTCSGQPDRPCGHFEDRNYIQWKLPPVNLLSDDRLKVGFFYLVKNGWCLAMQDAVIGLRYSDSNELLLFVVQSVIMKHSRWGI